MDQTQLESFRQRLEDERAGIERQLGEYGAAANEEGMAVRVDEGFADSAQATAERSEIVSTIEQLRSAHADVMAALVRIDDGTYGKCERCGQPIPIERLEALPTASLCVSCKESASSR